MASLLPKPIATLFTAPTTTKYIFDLNEGTKDDVSLLSVKGANLCATHRLGYSVPPAFIISTDAAVKYRNVDAGVLNNNLQMEVVAAVSRLEASTGLKFGNVESGKFPLILGVRGGSPTSTDIVVGNEETDVSVETINNEVMDVLGAPDSWCFPGIKESCLGIGLTDAIVDNIASMTSKGFAHNIYAHFLIRYGTLVLNIPKSKFRAVLAEFEEQVRKSGEKLSEDQIGDMCAKFRALVDLPQDPIVQLFSTINVMYDAWFDSDAVVYRQEALNMDIDQGLAIIVQSLVLGETGVAFSRNPVTGDTGDGVYGCLWESDGRKKGFQDLSKTNAALIDTIYGMVRPLEMVFEDMVQLEFVVVDKKDVHILQVMRARRTAQASVRVAVDLVQEEIINEREAILRINTSDPNLFFRFDFSNLSVEDMIGQGQTASRGITIGSVAFTAVDCLEIQAQGKKAILFQQDAEFCDERVIKQCDALVLMRGSVLSTPSNLCRALGIPCIARPSGFKMIHVDEQAALEVQEGVYLYKGEVVTVNASRGQLFHGACNIVSLHNEEYFRDILHWADTYRTIDVAGKVVVPVGHTVSAEVECKKESFDAAEGIGYLTTDHMFSCSEDRLALIRMALITQTIEERQKYLSALETEHESDFKRIIASLRKTSSLVENKGPAANIVLGVKLLDKSLSSFLTSSDIDVTDLAYQVNMKVSDIKSAISMYHDHNPEIGLRGCRISALYPEITEMQVRALFKAVRSFAPDERIRPHIWVPAVSTVQELAGVVSLIEKVARSVATDTVTEDPAHKKDAESSTSARSTAQSAAAAVLMDLSPVHSDRDFLSCGYSIGVILDNPRACLRAETLRQHVNIFGIDLDSLTGHVYGCSKRDAEKLFPRYELEHILVGNPFRSLDDKGVGRLIKTALQAIRGHDEAKPRGLWDMATSAASSAFGEAIAPDDEVAVCIVEGNQVLDNRSMTFFEEWDIDEICVPAQQVPLAKLLCAQTALLKTTKRSWWMDTADYTGVFTMF